MKKIINCNGKMSILGVSTPNDKVIKAMNLGSKNFYIMDNLYQHAEEVVMKKFQVSDAFLVASAASGIVYAALAATRYAQKNHQNNLMLIPCMHQINFGAPVTELLEMGGANLISFGASNLLSIDDLMESIDQYHPAAIFLISSHHVPRKPQVDLAKIIKICRAHKIMTILDIAAEEDIEKFIALNADILILSGSKALNGPTSGVLLLRKPTLKNHLKYFRAHQGRCMKLDKGNIWGFIEAVKQYQYPLSENQANKNIEKYLKKISNPLIHAQLSIEKSRNIKRIKITSKKIKELDKYLWAYNISTRNYGLADHYLELDLRQISLSDLEFVIDKINDFK